MNGGILIRHRYSIGRNHCFSPTITFAVLLRVLRALVIV
jgi:hypothetical protein